MPAQATIENNTMSGLECADSMVSVSVEGSEAHFRLGLTRPAKFVHGLLVATVLSSSSILWEPGV
jgi:hypothetical protein